MKTRILHAAIFTPFSKGRWGLPLAFEGEPGIAKSDMIEGFASSCGMPCETLCPGERGEAAFGVVPVPHNGVLTYPRPDWTEKFIDDVGGIVFVDEITTAPPIIQAALLGLLLRRTIGGYTFGKRVRIVAAYNPPELAAGGFDLAAPLANRCGHLKWDPPTAEEHTAYMLSGGTGNGGHHGNKIDALAEEARVEALWADAWARARGLETAFITRRSELKNKCPKPGDPNASRAWPSDRTWEMAARALASADVHKLSEVETEEFVSAFIGAGAASELFAFRAQNDLPDPADVLDGSGFKHNAARLDRTAAILNSCVALVTPPQAKKRTERTEALWAILHDLANGKNDMDILVPATISLIDAGLQTSKGALPVLAKLNPVLKASGFRAGSIGGA